MEKKAEVLADHYQRTFELTLDLWRQRNRTFMTLLLVVGVATLLTFKVAQAEPLLADLIAQTFEIDDPDRLHELRIGFPYGLIQTILLMIVLYLMVLLDHRTTMISRHYVYLSEMEKDIRAELALAEEQVSFTREGRFYSDHRPSFSRPVALAYIGMLGSLLFAFLGMRIYTDLIGGNRLIVAIDVLLAIPTLVFFGAYAHASSSTIRRLFGGLRGKS